MATVVIGIHVGGGITPHRRRRCRHGISRQGEARGSTASNVTVDVLGQLGGVIGHGTAGGADAIEFISTRCGRFRREASRGRRGNVTSRRIILLTAAVVVAVVVMNVRYGPHGRIEIRFGRR